MIKPYTAVGLVPTEETEFLGRIAPEYDAFLMAQAKARTPT